ncbi:MAG: TolC family protein, partial [Duncaniella sp.]|nr:TolC family protein [Duncaniella sp.]
EKRYQAGETAVIAAKAALDAMTEKYNYGKANATEWEQAQSNYITSLAQQVQAKYEMILRNRILLFYNKQ